MISQSKFPAAQPSNSLLDLHPTNYSLKHRCSWRKVHWLYRLPINIWVVPGTPKLMVYNRKSYQHGWFGGTVPHFRKLPFTPRWEMLAHSCCIVILKRTAQAGCPWHLISWWKHIGAPSTTCDIWHASTTWQVLSLGPKGVCKTSMQLATRPEPGGNKGWPNIPPKPTALIMFCAAPRELCLNPLNHGVFVTVSLYKDPLHQGGGRFTGLEPRPLVPLVIRWGGSWLSGIFSYRVSMKATPVLSRRPHRWAARGRDDLLRMIKTYKPFLLIITKRPPNTKNRRPSPISENFRLANLIFNWSPLENNLKINLPFVGSPPNTKN